MTPTPFRNKKILLTGGAGFLGTHVARKLSERGARFEDIIIPRSDTLDLRDVENCRRAVYGKDIVIHLAGVSGNAEFHRKHPAEIFFDNLMIGVELMEAARQAGVKKFVTIGSVTEYPERAPLPFREEDVWSGFPEAIHAPYTVAKKMLLVEAQAYRKQYGFPAIHLLLTNIYGPGESTERGYVIPALISRIAEAKKKNIPDVEMWGTGAQTRDFLYVDDAAEGIMLATLGYDSPEPVNIASGWEISIRELGEEIARLMNFHGELRFNALRPEGQRRRVLDTSRAERGFGFRAVTDFRTGLTHTIRSHGYL